MTDRQIHPEGDLLERATAALRDTGGPAGPPPGVAASTLQALRALDTPPDTIRLLERRKLMFRIARYSGAAAALVAAVVAASLWLIDRTAQFTFAQVVDNVRRAKSVQFTLVQKVGNGPELKGEMFIQGDRFRYDIPDWVTWIVNGKERKGLELSPERKVARNLDFQGQQQAEAFKDPIDRLHNLKEDIKDSVERLPDEQWDGRDCHVYQVKGRIKNAPALLPDQFRLWVDAATGLPAKIVARDEHMYLRYDHFRWDQPLRDDLFSLQVPQGYLLEELTPAVVKPDRIYYQEGWIELHSIQPDGQNPEIQFVPNPMKGGEAYVADKTELSPDGRYLAIGYTHATSKGSFPPDRVLLWDRTQPREKPVEVYVRPNGELQSWQLAPDGRRLYVNWWEQLPGKRAGDGRSGTEVVDLGTGARQAVKLPMFRDIDGQEKTMRFAAASADAQTLLVVGNGLHVATNEGKVVRRLTPSDPPVRPDSVRLSPDGKAVLYTTDHYQLGYQLSVVPLTGGEPRVLVPAGGFTDLRARWSPNGKRIACTTRQLDPAAPPFYHGSETYLKVVDPSGSNAVTVLTRKGIPPAGTGLEIVAWR
jgi:outer membrane lipoprotein-sorting protein